MLKIDYETLSKNTWNLEWAQKNYNDYRVMKSLTYSIRGDYTFIDSNVYQYERLFVPTISMGPRGINARCQCSYNAEHDLCAHVLASMMLFETILGNTKKDEINEADFIAYQLKDEEEHYKAELDRFEQRQQEQRIKAGNQLTRRIQKLELSEIEDVVHKELYHLEFDIVLQVEEEYRYINTVGPNDYYADEVNIQISAKVGAEKMYVLKNFIQFNDLLVDEAFHSYGKHLSFKHQIKAFDKHTQKLLPKFLEYVENEANESYNARYLFMESNDLKFLYDLFKDYPREYLNVSFEQREFDVVLNVNQNDEYYEVTVDIPESVFVSNGELFYVDHLGVEHLKIENNKLRHVVTEVYTHKKLLFTYEDLQDVLYLLEGVDFEVRGFHYVDNNQMDLSLYIDLEDDHVIVKGYYFENDDKVNILKGDKKDSNLNKVMFILDSFATETEENHYSLSLREDKTYRFLEEGLLLLEGLCTVYADESLKNIERPTALNLSVGVMIDNGLLELKLESIQMSKDDIFNVLMEYRRKKKYYKLQSGEIVNLESKDMRDLDEFVESMALSPRDLLEESIKVPLYRSLMIDHQSSTLQSLAFDVDEHLKTFNENFKKHTLDNIVINEHSDILKAYQKDGVKWLMLMKKYGFNGILADDMGLGKTLQVIALLDNMNATKPSIVICPASLLFNWEEELLKFNANLSYISIHGAKHDRDKLLKQAKSYDLIITTYDYLRSDYEVYETFDFANVIIDEAQYIKNQKTLTAKAVKTLNGKSKIALTGTPIENSLSELWSIFDFLMPGYLYSYASFRRTFELPIVKDNNIEKQRQLRSMVEPFILRRVKKDVLLDLPEKIEKTLKVEFSEQEEQLYTAKLVQGNKDVQAILQEDRIDNIEILKLLGELRQICCDPRMIYPEFPHVSSKVKACMELVESMKQTNKKILIFSSFVKSLDLIEHELRKQGIKYHMLTGSNSKEERQQLVKSFQTDDSTVFLISLKAAGVGLNLTAAEYVIHFDPWWNVAAENQASDRAHRIGQENTVQVYKLIMKNSIEEKILKMQERKQDMADIFVEGASGSFASLSRDDILDLFKR